MNNEICLLNDSFPPLIDGVANTVVNYARVINASEGSSACVVVPEFPGADDSRFDYPVIRYPSIDVRKLVGYTAGSPFAPATIHELKQRDIELLHCHCPVASQMMARQLREVLNVPLVMTYHTKFDVDIRNAIHGRVLQEGAVKALVENVSASDELWVVSNGAGENIRKLGYKGDYVVMNNGVDMPRYVATDAEIIEATEGYKFPEGVPVFLFVGRLMWYKGIRIILDAMAALKSQNLDFRMVFIGNGNDEKEIKRYAATLRLGGKCYFPGAVHSRSKLAAWYAKADLLIFPSTFDTNGLVVREAAACSLGSVLVKGSCAAEGVTDRQNALLIDENAASLAVCLARYMDNFEFMKKLGKAASDELYISWDDAIHTAMERYEIVKDNYACGRYKKKRRLVDAVFMFEAGMLEAFDDIISLEL